MRINSASWASLVGVSLLLSAVAVAEIPNKMEPDYSEAVLAYNAKEYVKAISILNTMLEKVPDLTEALELKALSLKATKDEKESVKTYMALIEAKTKAGKPGNEIAPYHFELGMMKFREKQIKDAVEHFRMSLENGFNEGPSHLYIGLAAFQSGSWSDAEEHFRGVVSSGPRELRPAAYFYLGQTYMKTGYTGGATHNLV